MDEGKNFLTDSDITIYQRRRSHQKEVRKDHIFPRIQIKDIIRYSNGFKKNRMKRRKSQ